MIDLAELIRRLVQEGAFPFVDTMGKPAENDNIERPRTARGKAELRWDNADLFAWLRGRLEPSFYVREWIEGGPLNTCPQFDG